MKKYRLKKSAVLGIYGTALVVFLGTMVIVEKAFFEQTPKDDNYNYVSQTIFSKDIPVVGTTPTIIRPYTDSEVKIIKDFYDYQDKEEKQKNSIIYYESTYLQNSGISYGGKKDPFDVVAILDGKVIDVKEDNTLGKIVEIRHTNDLISVYQSLSEITVKKDDEIKQGTIIGKSGTSNISKDSDNHLQFELIIKGQVVNPEKYYDKKVDEL